MDKKEKILQIEKWLLESDKPSEGLNKLLKKEELNEYPFNMLGDLAFVQQSPKYHSEGVVWNHTMLVIDEGAKYREKSSNPKRFMFGLLLHDIGKARTTKFRKGRLTSYNHDKVGKEMGEEFLREFDIFSEKDIKEIKDFIGFHMHHIYISKKLPFGNEEEMKKKKNLKDILLIFICDRSGRGGIGNKEKEEIKKEVYELYDSYKKEGIIKEEFKI